MRSLSGSVKVEWKPGAGLFLEEIGSGVWLVSEVVKKSSDRESSSVIVDGKVGWESDQ